MAGLGKRRPARMRSGVSGLQGRQVSPASPRVAGDGPVTIERLAHDGRGVAHTAAGKTLFVDGALPGERLEVAVHRARKRFDEGHVRELVTPSPERVTPPCAHFGRCGGCDLQHLALDAQRHHKVAVLLELLARQGIEPPPAPQLLAGAGEGYRRRARLGIKVDAEGDVHLGFRARHSHRLVDIADCTILVPSLSALLTPLHALVASLEAPRQAGHLELLESDQGVVLVLRQLREHDADRGRWLAFAEHHGLHLARLLGRETPRLEWLTPAPALSCRVPGPGEALTLGFAPGDFLQANAEINRQLIQTALAWLGDVEGLALLDLFAGVGNFSLPLAAAGARVTAVEGSPAMVERLAGNARRNDLEVHTRQADLGRAGVVAELLASGSPEVVVLDPPRDGAAAVCRTLVEHPVPRLLYVSCDPATLARDAARLVHGGYRPSRIAVADMFAHTSHLESMLLFEHPRTGRQPLGVTPDG
ncbi:TRAM domain-containing protein [Halomonas kalidii]|uniref:23S rRNA (uracil(1939)-C(5))-methyltransferase RlmD n=1 Tax=Halomonas kalidii TaxID=3043293 RepID=A0ABT6VSC8_9GAMM|nr:TRAM domain-containing protein [Halomonas kalidii]MDI5936580.1 TRAM domain-containing protein [Halomonas kalidii]